MAIDDFSSLFKGYGKAEVSDFSGRLTFCATEKYFDKSIEMANKYPYEAINIEIWDNYDIPIKLDFNKIARPHDIKYLSFLGRNKSIIDFKSNKSTFEKMKNLSELSIMSVKNASDLHSFFPNLKGLFYIHNPTKITHFEKYWPKMDWLQIQSFKGNLSTLGNHKNLRHLTLVKLNTDSLDHLENFPNLEGIEIHSLRKSLDISVLSKLKKLKKVMFYGTAMQQGWDDLILPQSVEVAGAFRLPSMKLIENNPHVNSILASEVGNLKKKDLKQKGWISRGTAGMEHRQNSDIIGNLRIR